MVGKVSQELMIGHKKLRGRLASEAPACAGSCAAPGSLWSVPGTRARGPQHSDVETCIEVATPVLQTRGH